MKKLCVLLVLSVGFLSACTDEGETTAAHKKATERKHITTDNPVLEQSMVGVYIGQLPCATCETMLTSIILRDDNSYAISTKAVHDTSLILPLVDSGSFVIRGHILELTDVGGTTTRYRIKGEELAQLGDDGAELNSKDRQEYTFKKQH